MGWGRGTFLVLKRNTPIWWGAVAAACLLLPAGPGLRAAEPVRFGFAGPEIFPVENQIEQLKAADVDGDGLTDVLVVNNARSKINVLLNQTGVTNKPAKAQAGAKRQINELPPDARFRIDSIASEKRISALAVADLDGDDRPDIAYYGEPKELVVLYNQGTNRWASPKRYPIDDGQLSPNALTAGDISGDSRADLALLAENQVYLLLQDKEGGLGEPQKVPFSGVARSVQIIDVNDDERHDLVLVNWEDRNPMRFRLQQENGALGPEIFLPFSPVRAYWIDWLESKEKTRLITIAQNSGRAQVSAFKQQPAEKLVEGIMQGQFQAIPLSKTAKARRGIRWADANSDRLSDLVVADPETGQLSVLLQQTDGTLASPKAFPTLAGVSELAVEDWNEDGRPEIFLLSPDERQVGVAQLDEKGAIGFPELIPVSGRPLVFAVGRPGADRPPVLAILTDEDGKRALVLRGASGEIKRIPLNESFRGTPASMSFEDADQDGMADLVILTPYEKIKVMRQSQDLAFDEIDLAPPGGLIEQPWLSRADVDADGKAELLVTQRNFLRAVILEQDAAVRSATNRAGWTLRVKEQVNGAGSNSRITGAAALQRGSTNSPLLFLLDAERKALTLCERSADGVWKIVRNILLPVSDFHALQPVSLGGTNRNAIALLGLNVAGLLPLFGDVWTLSEIDSYETPIRQGHLRDMVAGDLDSDGKKDIVFLETARNYVDVVAVNADGKLEPSNRWPVFEERTFRARRGDISEPREAVVHDFTGDGKPDLAIIVHDRVILYSQE
jgi:hypothetical protein